MKTITRNGRVVCECCARQIVSGQGTPDKYVTFGPATSLGFGKWACLYCAVDLDENGLFPEERKFI